MSTNGVQLVLVKVHIQTNFFLCSDVNVIKRTIFPIKVNLNCDDPDQRNYDFSIPKVRLPKGDFIELKCTEEDFASAWINRFKINNSGDKTETTVYGHSLDIRMVLKVKEDILNEIIQKPLEDFKEVKSAFLKYKKSDTFVNDVYNGFDTYIEKLKSNNQYKYAKSVRTSRNNIYVHNNGFSFKYSEITKGWIESYSRKRRETVSIAPVSIDLTNIRTVFNSAIEKNKSLQELYPFGKGGFSIPKSSSKNIGLTKKVLKKIQDFSSDNPIFRWLGIILCLLITAMD